MTDIKDPVRDLLDGKDPTIAVFGNPAEFDDPLKVPKVIDVEQKDRKKKPSKAKRTGRIIYEFSTTPTGDPAFDAYRAEFIEYQIKTFGLKGIMSNQAGIGVGSVQIDADSDVDDYDIGDDAGDHPGVGDDVDVDDGVDDVDDCVDVDE